MGLELRIYAKRGGEALGERWGGAHVASWFGYLPGIKLTSCTKLLSCAEEQAPEELIFACRMIINALTTSHQGKTPVAAIVSLSHAHLNQLTALRCQGISTELSAPAVVLMLAFEEPCTAQIVPPILMKTLMEKSAFPQQHGSAAPSLFFIAACRKTH